MGLVWKEKLGPWILNVSRRDVLNSGGSLQLIKSVFQQRWGHVWSFKSDLRVSRMGKEGSSKTS